MVENVNMRINGGINEEHSLLFLKKYILYYQIPLNKNDEFCQYMLHMSIGHLLGFHTYQPCL